MNGSGGRARVVAIGLTVASLGLLLLVGALGPSAAKPPLGERGWGTGTLPWSPGSATVSALLVLAYLTGAVGVAIGLVRRVRLPWGWTATGVLAALALATQPFGSADHVNYAAYGRILVGGGDPFSQSPIDWAGGSDPVTSAVEAPWTTTPSIYGPFGTAAMGLASLVGGSNLRQTVMAWQVVIVLCWLAVRWILLRGGASRSRVDLLWTANPLVFGVGVLGAHVDLIATALAVAALVSARHTALAAGVLCGLAASTKVTYGCVAAGLVIAWALAREAGWVRRVGMLVLGFIAVAVPLHLWAGSEVFGQLGKARRSVSLATPWRPIVEMLTGPLQQATVRSLVFALSAVVCLLLTWLLLRLTGGLVADDPVSQGIRWTFALATAYALGAPYSLPWYDQLSWALLPLLAASALDLVLLGRAAIMALAYVPGRVLGMSENVKSVTLGFRRHVAPYAALLAWVAVGWLARLDRCGRAGPECG
ncbi:MAG: hypothetical protein LWW86_14280 [Micrococcales bacterium]|nr:hypothetical protein [Micrococcales bacterium]